MTTESNETTEMTEILHHIEERAVVWLRLSLDGKSWEIDSPSDDGYPLEGYDDGAVHDACDYCDELFQDKDPRADEIHREGADLADDYQRLPDIPTLAELYTLIGDYLGERIPQSFGAFKAEG